MKITNVRPEGIRRNVALVRTLREDICEDYDIMLDAWQSWDYHYAVRVCQESQGVIWIQEFPVKWNVRNLDDDH
ncbi:MAG: hypothetical protein HY678_06470 [Chloroflexi bacterium]|nr:hypothetical protein [Chloroflexota bacterium]